ncbi:hypothetical protein ACWEKT_20005 [Nocardia takedensis]|uniref:hypothetical protein n=1 Tax=Nocardia takedensis TaxID=259390 RepID=UPI0012F69360|nr:hypothetical protein [Nocardia takedensis]
MSKASDAVAAAGGWKAWFGPAGALRSDAPASEKADRGRELEAALVEMFDEAGLDPRSGYRPQGEEVDGSIVLDGRTYLFEAKWTSEAHPASSLYQFKGKVEGKLAGTLGLFFSMSGYSNDAIGALVAGKELDIVLFNDTDIELVVEGTVEIAQAIRLKLRAAAESGTPYVPLKNLLTARRLRTMVGERPKTVFVEGLRDERILRFLRERTDATLPVRLMPAGGPANMARMIDAVLQIAGQDMPFVAILEEDESGRRSGLEVQGLVDRITSDGGQATLLWIPGSLEESLGLGDPDGRPIWRVSEDQLFQRLVQVDLDERVRSHPALVPVLRAVGIPVPGR